MRSQRPTGLSLALSDSRNNHIRGLDGLCGRVRKGQRRTGTTVRPLRIYGTDKPRPGLSYSRDHHHLSAEPTNQGTCVRVRERSTYDTRCFQCALEGGGGGEKVTIPTSCDPLVKEHHLRIISMKMCSQICYSADLDHPT